MAEENDKLTLRDKLAVEVLNGMLANEKVATNKTVDFISYGLNYEEWNAPNRRLAEQQMTQLIRAAYKIADIIRKVRLTTFE